MRPRLPMNCVFKQMGLRDDYLLAAAFQKLEGGLDLRLHASRRKMAFGHRGVKIRVIVDKKEPR